MIKKENKNNRSSKISVKDKFHVNASHSVCSYIPIPPIPSDFMTIKQQTHQEHIILQISWLLK